MRKKSIFIFIFVLLALVMAGVVFFSKRKTVSVIIPAEKNTVISPAPASQPFFVAGWLPYWQKTEGAAEFEKNISFFSEINPFAFGVNPDGSLKDTLEIKESPWPDLAAQAGKNNVVVVPTILWGDAQAMHNVFADKNLLNDHLHSIVKMLDENNFPGVDIDYEGKDVADRDLFSSFLELLHKKLAGKGKTLNCTVEARTRDLPPAGFSGTRAMSFANDFSALNNDCDSVRLMAYDEVFQIHRANSFADPGENPAAPNADNPWVEEVINYALRFITPEKIMLGIPTYGWEFQLEKLETAYRYMRYQSISCPKAIEEAKAAGVTPVRDSGGELSFVYQVDGQEHIATFSDAESIRQKILLAKKYNLKGVSLFKLDGLADPQLYPLLAKISASK